MSASNKGCAAGSKCCCGGKKAILILASLLFMVAISYIYGLLLAIPVTIFMFFFIPTVFASFAQGLFCITFSFALLFLLITVLSRMAQLSLGGSSYLRQTFYYDFLKE